MEIDIDKRIEELNIELDNLHALWQKEIIEASKDRKLSLNTAKLEKVFKKISDKYTPTMNDREDELEELMLKKDKGV